MLPIIDDLGLLDEKELVLKALPESVGHAVGLPLGSEDDEQKSKAKANIETNVDVQNQHGGVGDEPSELETRWMSVLRLGCSKERTLLLLLFCCVSKYAETLWRPGPCA